MPDTITAAKPADVAAVLEPIRRRTAAAKPGPWIWRGNIDTGEPYLASHGYVTDPKTGDRHRSGDVLGHIRHEVTRAEARRRGVGDPDFLPEIRLVPCTDPVGCNCYDERYDAQIKALRDEAITEYLTDEYGEPRKESRLAFCTDWFYTVASKLVTFEVAPEATDREDPKVYRADITGIRHPDAEFIAHSREDVGRLLAALDAVLAFADDLEAPPAPHCGHADRLRQVISRALLGEDLAAP
jgi:hypothetical protein